MRHESNVKVCEPESITSPTQSVICSHTVTPFLALFWRQKYFAPSPRCTHTARWSGRLASGSEIRQRKTQNTPPRRPFGHPEKTAARCPHVDAGRAACYWIESHVSRETERGERKGNPRTTSQPPREDAEVCESRNYTSGSTHVREKNIEAT